MLVLCLLGFAGVAAAQGTCSIQTIQGMYALEYTGFLAVLPVSVLGTVTIAGNGASATGVQVAPAGVTPFSTKGELTVSPDCTATITYPGITEKAVILNNGDEIRGQFIDPVTMQSLPFAIGGTLHRITPGSCPSRQLKGRYAQVCSGFVAIAGGGGYIPSRFIGTISLDTAGTFTGNGTIVFGGRRLDVVYKDGAFNMGPDCRGTASFSFEGNPTVWSESLVMYEQGKRYLSTTTRGPEIDLCEFVSMDR